MPNVLCVLESFRRHMDNGRWLFQQGLEAAGWVAVGHGLAGDRNTTDCVEAARRFRPQVMLLWPRYEWDNREWVGNEVKPEHRFSNWDRLPADVLRVAVLHDARSTVRQQRAWLRDFQPHVVLGWYHATSVLPFWPAIKPEQYERTYHILDASAVPPVEDRAGRCAISGAQNQQVYPLRMRASLAAYAGELGPGVDVPPHPGYVQTGTHSNDYVRTLARYRVALCTSSIYDFALRKVWEATAAGCRVITDLPAYDFLPGIDGNLRRVPRDFSIPALRRLIDELADTWDLEQQRAWSAVACEQYDYRAEGARVAAALALHAARRAA